MHERWSGLTETKTFDTGIMKKSEYVPMSAMRGVRYFSLDRGAPQVAF